MVQGIRLTPPLTDIFGGTTYFGILNNIRHVNTFVGVNNSGKSRFLRTVFASSKDVNFIINIDEQTKLKLISSSKQLFDGLLNLKRRQITYKYQRVIERHKEFIESDSDDELNHILDLYLYLSTLRRAEFTLVNRAYEHELNRFLTNSASYVQNFAHEINKIGIENRKVPKIYIPILRGMRPIAEKESQFTNDNIYLNRTKHDYFKGDVPNGQIFTGLSMYESVKKLLLGDESERNEIIKFEEFLEINLFKKKINLIPKYDDDVLHIKMGSDLQFPIYKLGDGLQTLIIILFPLFINRKKEHIVFIEEPETHLHPKWQRLLYRAMTMFKNHTYFLSTHSSVFINSINNSIFIVSKQKKKTHLHYSDVKTEKVTILKELGYKPNDLYQTNYLLWVEGQSDKVYINYMIQQLDKSLIEGEDYSIMFYGGSSYKHFLMNNGDLNLEFIQSLNQNYGIIMDSDRTKSRERYKPQKKAIVELFTKNKAFCWLTNLREIENYIPFSNFENAVKSVHRVKNIEIDQNPFGDRCSYVDLDARPNYKPKIKLSNEFFSKVQKNKNGSVKGIPIPELRQEIEASINATKRTVNGIDKIKVAEKIVKEGFILRDVKLLKKMDSLVKEIRKANE